MKIMSGIWKFPRFSCVTVHTTKETTSRVHNPCHKLWHLSVELHSWRKLSWSPPVLFCTASMTTCGLENQTSFQRWSVTNNHLGHSSSISRRQKKRNSFFLRFPAELEYLEKKDSTALYSISNKCFHPTNKTSTRLPYLQASTSSFALYLNKFFFHPLRWCNTTKSAETMSWGKGDAIWQCFTMVLVNWTYCNWELLPEFPIIVPESEGIFSGKSAKKSLLLDKLKWNQKRLGTLTFFLHSFQAKRKHDLRRVVLEHARNIAGFLSNFFFCLRTWINHPH